MQPADEGEQALDVRVRQAAGRLVQHDDARAARQRPRDLDELLRGGRADPRPAYRADVRMAELAERVDCRLPHRPASAIRPTANRLQSQTDVLHDRQVRRERQLLMNHRDAGPARFERIARRIRRAVQRHRSGVRPDRAGQNRHQRALPGAVLADERAHFAGGHGEVDAVHARWSRRTPSARRASRTAVAHFSHFERSGFSSSFIAGSFMFCDVARLTPVSMRFSTGSPLMCDTSVLTARYPILTGSWSTSASM